jgi:hypothetical protein
MPQKAKKAISINIKKDAAYNNRETASLKTVVS